MFGIGGNGSNGARPRPGGGLIDMQGIRKVYSSGPVEVEALRGVDLLVDAGEMVAIVGPSGSGKSTLMNIIGCLDTATGGSYRLRGEEVAGLSVDRLAAIRNRRVGFVFQSFNLLPQLSAFENVEMPLLFAGKPARERRARVEELLDQVGLADRRFHRPTEMSGGQMQRVAIARALACAPDIILADEPTGNLDSAAGKDIIGMFEQLWQKGHTLVLITHDAAVARRTRRIIRIEDGRIVEDAAPASSARHAAESGLK
ncbi:MAG TPA: ABC transporter ATP-binding protein [Thermoanaerobaculaceae bacterium]|nr:ABC transporter ATP-binding protein [Thermoanaerobaculaceae bacterium]HRS15837.1 ABC transporter ATP-binding protein [Thermoanaerobaculaceae bacterium]